MAKIGLIDVDNTKFPNLALMKIASYHKAMGDSVEFVGLNSYDRTYASKVFTYTKDFTPSLAILGEIQRGGTGYKNYNDLPNEIDSVEPDYSIYGITDTAYGFLTRGCPNACKWCVVPKKEGTLKPYKDIEQVLQGRKKAILMDNNILASDYGIEQIEKIVQLKVKVDFNQGLDARMLNEEIAKLLSKVQWIRSIRFACDTQEMIKPVLNAMKLLEKYGIRKWRFDNYLLLNGNIEDAYHRASIMRNYGASISPQPYRDFENNNNIPIWQKDFARWGNRKELYRSTDFKDYQARKGFICKSYFD